MQFIKLYVQGALLVQRGTGRAGDADFCAVSMSGGGTPKVDEAAVRAGLLAAGFAELRPNVFTHEALMGGVGGDADGPWPSSAPAQALMEASKGQIAHEEFLDRQFPDSAFT